MKAGPRTHSAMCHGWGRRSAAPTVQGVTKRGADLRRRRGSRARSAAVLERPKPGLQGGAQADGLLQTTTRGGMLAAAAAMAGRLGRQFEVVGADDMVALAAQAMKR